MSNAAPVLVSEEEFASLPESTERIELLDGEVILSPSPSFRHQEILLRLVRALADWAAAQSAKVTAAMAPLDVRFGPGRILQPDAFVLFAEVPHDHQGPIRQIPELCVEILSTNRTYDRMAKRLVYADAGVRELWTVELDGTVERWHGERLTLSERRTDELTSALLPGFSLDLEQLGE